MKKRLLAAIGISIVTIIALVTALLVSLYSKMEEQLARTYRGYDEKELSGVIDAKEMLSFYSRKDGASAPVSNYIRSKAINRVCLDQPYGLPPENLSLNGLPEPDDGVSYLSFFVDGGEHYYAVPLDRAYQVPSRGCKQPNSTLVSYPCDVHGISKICLRWSEVHVGN